MPLPWKKSKGSRISRFVKDFQDLQSPKRGKSLSLVVETGFPTSLVDLFVKNRDRLKNSSKKRKEKKQKQQQQQREVVDHQLVITDPVPSAGFKDSSDHAFTDPRIGDRGRDNPVEVRSGYCLDGCDKLVSALPIEENAVLPVDDVNRCWGEDEKRVMLVVLKVFVVVVLGLSTKELAVGITMSAFVLLFLEYAGKHILCFLSPCSKARLAVDPFVRKICSFLLALKQFKIRQDSSKFGAVIRDGNAFDDISSVDSCVLDNNPQLDCCVEEIQSAESSFHMASQFEESRREDLPGVDKRCGESSDVLGMVKLDECKSGGGLGCEKGCSQSGKSKRKIMKKFVPKKFLKRKKGKKNGKDKETDSEASSSCWAEDKLGKTGVIEEQQQGGYREDFKNKGELLPLPLLEGRHERDRGIGEGKEEIDRSSYSCTTRLQTKTDMVETKKKGEVLRKGGSCLPIVFVVVLAGLMGGRIPALLLTVSACLILKMVQRYRYV
ncbi:hypothetical protein Tsubulata_011200 [Turnera subulata]|uniref:Uncharacterized protein n=1 Tax=Turnera subulata TaxID=218843 RepID=A0A9Q0JFZ5_9ROSI|nr:hypothetical protein Tsubulata_011200 [Turnera subulata]